MNCISALPDTIQQKPLQQESTLKTSTIKIDAHTAKWLNYKVDKSEDTETKPEEPIPQKNNERRLSGFSRLSSYTPAMSIAKSSLSSDSNSDSPKTVKKFQKAYAGKRTHHQWKYIPISKS